MLRVPSGDELDHVEVVCGAAAPVRCETAALAGRELRRTGSAVVVTASATEVYPTSFVVALRLRPIGGERDDPLNVTSVVRLVHPATGAAHELGNAVRDELIALEHAARHFN